MTVDAGCTAACINSAVYHGNNVCRVQIIWIVDKPPKAILGFSYCYDWCRYGLRLLQHPVAASDNDHPITNFIFFPLCLVSLYFIVLCPVQCVMWTEPKVCYYNSFTKFTFITDMIEATCLNKRFAGTRWNSLLLHRLYRIHILLCHGTTAILYLNVSPKWNIEKLHQTFFTDSLNEHAEENLETGEWHKTNQHVSITPNLRVFFSVYKTHKLVCTLTLAYYFSFNESNKICILWSVIWMKSGEFMFLYTASP